MFEVFLYSLLVMLASLIGVVAIWHKAGKFIEKNLRFLVSFSAGVFLVVSYQLALEAFHQTAQPLVGLAWVVVGAAGIWLVFWLLPVFHHHHDEHEEEHSHSRLDARRILTGDAIHNLGDGVLLAATFTVSTALGAVTAVSVFIHELVQEISEFFVLRQAGFSPIRAVSINFLISSTILIGSIGGFLLIDHFFVIEGPLLGITAGAFLVVVFFDLIPHSVRSSETKIHYGQHLAWFLVGVLLMTGVNQIAVHSHEGEDAHGHEEEHEHGDHVHEEERGHEEGEEH